MEACMLFLTLLLIVCITFYLYLTRNYDYWKKRSVFYNKPSLIIGNFGDVIFGKKHVNEWVRDIYNSTDQPYLGVFLFDTPYLMIRDPAIVKNILNKDFKYFQNRMAATAEHNEVLKRLLILVKNPSWKLIKQKISPIFTPARLRATVELLNDTCENLIGYMQKNAKNGYIDAKELFGKYVTDVIAKWTYGIDARCFATEDAEFRRVSRSLNESSLRNAVAFMSMFFAPKIMTLFKINLIGSDNQRFLSTVFYEAISKRKNVESKEVLIDLLNEIKRNNGERQEEDELDDVTLLSQSIMFFIAGTETTGLTMCYLLYELAFHPEIQNKLRQEIEDIWKQEGEKITYNSITNMKYLDLCWKETLRKYPVVGFLDRICNENYKIPGHEFVIEKNTPVLIALAGLHADEKYYPNPEEFIPERFSEKTNYNQDGYNFLPFGEGPRMCIGDRFGTLVGKLGLINVLLKFKVEKAENTSKIMKPEPRSLTNQPIGGFPIKFVPT